MFCVRVSQNITNSKQLMLLKKYKSYVGRLIIPVYMRPNGVPIYAI